MKSQYLNFTEAALKKLPAPVNGERMYYRDTEVKGLVFAVQASGAKSFYLSKKIINTTEKIFIGKYPDLTLHRAREKAKLMLAQIVEGIHPKGKTGDIFDSMTFKELFDMYMERYSKPHKKSWKYDEREVNRFLSHWFNRKISTITKKEIRLLHEKLFKENGLYQANRILERIRAIYNKAIEWDWKGINPTLGIKKYKELSRDRFILPNEMPFLLKAVNEESNETVKDFLQILLLTGARKTNTLQMRWEEISWEMKSWRIPDSKNGEPVVLPLVERAFAILHTRFQHIASQWVFPNEDSDSHYADPKRAWSRILKRATIHMWSQNEELKPLIVSLTEKENLFLLYDLGYNRIIAYAVKNKLKLPKGLTDIRIHDVRRTLGSYQAIGGSSLQIIGRSLGHKSLESTQVYARLILEPVRQSMEQASKIMFTTDENMQDSHIITT